MIKHTVLFLLTAFVLSGFVIADNVKDESKKSTDISEVFMDTAIAYCWMPEVKETRYICYGPTQKLLTNYKNLEVALERAGCDGAVQKNYWGSKGLHNGAVFECQDTRLRSYHNSPQQIMDWVSEQ